ncbi:MAG: beta-lactamase family protein [Bacteroidales bacterium]|nr:beta-lactamase family protein [Bacteroidales bacterium]MBN2819071.1 beta-lactamase family protein [Bacteroidales bacterium]
MSKVSFILPLLIINLVTGMAQDFTELQNTIENKLLGKLTPGIQYLIADKNGVIYEYEGGFANIDSQTPVTAETEMKMYSATKILTTIAIMQLYEQGKVILDEPVENYLPQYKFSDAFTIRQLLCHTSGVTNKPFVTKIHLASEHADFNEKEAAKQLIEENLKLKYKPGKKKAYSNFGFLILGEIVEEVSGVPYKQYVAENILNKIDSGNQQIGFSFNNKTARAYQKRFSFMTVIYKMVADKKYWLKKEGKFYSFEDLYINHSSYGGAFASSHAMLALGQELLNSDNTILKPETIKEMFTEQKLSNGKNAGHALGWWIGELDGHKYYYHPGGGGGYSCELRVYPDLGVVSVVMMNKTQDFSDLKLLSKFDKQVLGINK